MGIYTRTGDRGETDLLGGVRIAKDSPLLTVCGDFDELNSLLGMVRCESLPNEAGNLLLQIQRRLFDLGAELVHIASNQPGGARIGPADVAAIEEIIDRYEAAIGPTGEFILPGGCRAAVTLHLARAVCRRAERNLVSLARMQTGTGTASISGSDGVTPQDLTEPVPVCIWSSVPPDLLAYVNRLGDLMFILARASNAQAGIADTPC
jgi:cob(I)alamin adenosyltransferase